MKENYKSLDEDSNEAAKLICSPTPRIDGAAISDSDVGDLEYKLQIEAQDNCTGDGVVEANFFRTLDDE